MPVQISPANIQKLTHESLEIRIRTLEQIEAKVMRALAHNEEIEFKPGELFKQLVRWFGLQPLECMGKVLKLMLTLLNSRYGDCIIEQLGVIRCQRELDKVKRLATVAKPSYLELVEDLLKRCRDYAERRKDVRNEIIDLTDQITIHDSPNLVAKPTTTTKNVHKIECSEEDYETPWTKPTSPDHNAMEFLAKLLINPLATCDELYNALQHLQCTMQDYPAEYFLQPPHIFLNLLKIYERHEELRCSLGDVLNALVEYMILLKERLGARRKTLTYAPLLRDKSPIVHQKTQLKLEKVVQLLLDLCLNYFENRENLLRNELLHIVFLFRQCLDICVMHKVNVKPQIINRLTRECKAARESYSQTKHFTFHRIYHLQLLFLLQRLLEIKAHQDVTTDSSYLYCILYDYTIKSCYAERYWNGKKLLEIESREDFTLKWKLLESYEQQFCFMVSLLRTPKAFKSQDIIERSCHLTTRALETFASAKVTLTLLSAIVFCLPQYMSNLTLRDKANNLLLKLLSLDTKKLATALFKCLEQTCKKHFAALMRGTPFAAAEGCSNRNLLASQIIGVPLSTSLLQKLTYCVSERPELQIKQSCEDILSMLLRSQHLLDSYWCGLLELLLPVVPLLQCCTHSAKITDALMELFDPDKRNLCFLELLKCNMRWLFHPEVKIRGECLSRLIYMLQMLENSSQYVPNVAEVGDLLPNDICLFSTQRALTSIFNEVASQSLNESFIALHNLLSLLDSTNIEPMIRKTALMQLDILCQQWPIAEAVCRDAAYYLVLKTIESALKKDSHRDYQDSTIPATGILAKLLCCDSVFREELSRTENIYVLLLRLLFLHANDLKARLDSATCLFLLLFSSFLVILPPSGSGESGVEVPALINNLQLPVKLQLRAQASTPAIKSTPYAIFETNSDEAAYLRPLIASLFCDGLCKVNQAWLDTQKEHDFNAELQLTQRDWHLMKATQPLKNLRRFLQSAENATGHATVRTAALSLKLQLVLNDMSCERTLSCIPNDTAKDLLRLLNKYLQFPPGNEEDFMLFEQLLEVCYVCIQLKCTVIIEGVFKVLRNDFQHSFIILLQHPETALRLYRKLSQTLILLLQSIDSTSEELPSISNGDSINGVNGDRIFYSNLFEILFTVSKLFFDQRDLLRVRSVLSILQTLSTKNLEMPDTQLFFYCIRSLDLSVSLKSYTQTASQWHRDCLHIVCQLNAQMKEAQKIFKLNVSCLKFLSVLCGHGDYRVRSMAWCALGKVARFDDGTITGAAQLKNELAYLPGGFIACCLSTLLDYAEVCLVRHLAGNLFTELLPKIISDHAEAVKLLEQHDFYRFFYKALSFCELNSTLPIELVKGSDVNLNSSEVISCLCRICITMLQMKPAYISELCEKTFMFKLYELLKVPKAFERDRCNPAYLVMCADVCKLYTMCKADNFTFLQRTLCRDQVWLRSFYLLLHKSYAYPEDHVHVLQLLLAVCHDTIGFQYICENISGTPEFIVKMLMRAFRVECVNTSLQHYALKVLNFLLIKSQLDEAYDFTTFAETLERPIDLEEEQVSAREKVVTFTDSNLKKSCSSQSYNKSSAEIIFIELHRLFTHLYPLKACKFVTAPAALKQQVCETIGVLLKVSPLAQTTAQNLKFMEKILQIFTTHLEDFNTSCSTFIRRYGEPRKVAILHNYQILLNIVLSWFATGTAVLSNELQVQGVSKLLLQLWNWLPHSLELKTIILHLCAVLSKHSLVVCKQFSNIITPHSQSILQLILKIITSETQKIKPANEEDFPVISLGLRTAYNCCTCAEGRSTLVKARVFDIFDSMIPLNTRAPKVKPDIINSWLVFWEMFSRYSDGGKACHISALCMVVKQYPENSTTRLLTLRILRNMCFISINRSALMTSTDFMCTIDEVLSLRLDDDLTKFPTFEEQLIVSVAITKLISGGIKYIAAIRNSKLGKKIQMLLENLKAFKTIEQVKFNQIPFTKHLYDRLEVIVGMFTNLSSSGKAEI